MGELQGELDQIAHLDVAIIGGGVSGLYAGWRLIQEDNKLNTAVFEMSDRIGGRLLTWHPYGKECGLWADLGGMRFFEQQELVWNLINFLELERKPFYVSGPNLIWYLRGHHMASGDANTTSLFYALKENERGVDPDSLLQHVTNRVLNTPENQFVINNYIGKRFPESRKDWDIIKPYLTYKGQPLWNLGYWNVITDILSYEGYQFITDSLGYYSLTSNWNAAEAMQFMSLEFSLNPHYETIIDGFGQLPEKLCKEFLNLGGNVLLNAKLVRFYQNGDGSFRLCFVDSNNIEAVTTAKQVILALPKKAIEWIEPTYTFNLFEDLHLKQLINSVKGYPAFKLFLLYEYRWWEKNNGIFRGRSVTDLPIRQTYYFGEKNHKNRVRKSCSNLGLLMASYDDARAVDYWKGLELPSRFRTLKMDDFNEELTAMSAVFSGALYGEGKKLKSPQNFYKAPVDMLRAAKKQLADLHGLNLQDIPDPIIGVYADWSSDPFGAGWHFWQPQINVNRVMKKVQRPLGNANVFIVGEAYSGIQGWVEGALTFTELVLQREFNLKRPSWLPPDYYLGL